MIIRWLFISSIFVVALFGINLKSFFTYTFDANKQYDMEKAIISKKDNPC